VLPCRTDEAPDDLDFAEDDEGSEDSCPIDRDFDDTKHRTEADCIEEQMMIEEEILELIKDSDQRDYAAFEGQRARDVEDEWRCRGLRRFQ